MYGVDVGEGLVAAVDRERTAVHPGEPALGVQLLEVAADRRLTDPELRCKHFDAPGPVGPERADDLILSLLRQHRQTVSRKLCHFQSKS